uniref:Uncharacterized protein n=1 Tax=Arundo donax TaxID=35708 RepID=A0A0A9FBC8_ARUDO
MNFGEENDKIKTKKSCSPFVFYTTSFW